MSENAAKAHLTPIAEPPETRLDRLDKEEFWDVARIACPDLTREKFEDLWLEVARRAMN